MAQINIPQGVTVSVIGEIVKVKGPKGETEKKLFHPKLIIKASGDIAEVITKEGKMMKKDKMFINTFIAHLKNLIKGVVDGYEHRLKICSGHFPLTVSVSGDEVIIKNFLGEKVPRKTKIMKGAKVEINGDQVIVTGINREVVGQTAARIEQATRITNRDRRIFQDGCYIISKAGKAVATK